MTGFCCQKPGLPMDPKVAQAVDAGLAEELDTSLLEAAIAKIVTL